MLFKRISNVLKHITYNNRYTTTPNCIIKGARVRVVAGDYKSVFTFIPPTIPFFPRYIIPYIAIWKIFRLVYWKMAIFGRSPSRPFGSGASLKALYMMEKKYGYHLIGIVTQNDLFFINAVENYRSIY